MKAVFQMISVIVLSLSLLVGCGPKEMASTAADTQKSQNKQEAKGDTPAAKTVNLTFYYPVAVAGPLAKAMDSYVNEFNQTHPNIKVQPVYSGDYTQTKTKVLAAVKGGNMPDVAVIGAAEVLGLKNADAIVPLDSYIQNDPDGEAYAQDFFPAFFSKIENHYWSIPFQRSTPIVYYNKDAFKEVGLDPNHPPANWNELEAYAKKLMKRDDSGQTTRWGVKFGADDIWMFQGFEMQGFSQPQRIFNEAGTKVDFNTDASKDAIKFFLKLKEEKVLPDTIVQWGTLTSDFVAGKTAMIYYSTGGLSFIRDNAKFDFGATFLPAGKQYATPTGGGNLYMLNTGDKEKQKATWEFIRWMTTPERAAKWSIDSGYVAVRKAAYNVPSYKEYTAKYPQALVARDQLQYAQAELSTYNNGEVGKVMSDTLQGIFLGKIPLDQGLADAQSKIDKALAPFAK